MDVRRVLVAAACAALLLPAAGLAQVKAPADAVRPMGGGHGGHTLSTTVPGIAAGQDLKLTKGRSAPSSLAYAEANARMHNEMSIEPTGDADRDFVKQMIPHHQGAIAMAKVILQYGKDPQLKSLAEKIIADQDREVREMKAWLREHPE